MTGTCCGKPGRARLENTINVHIMQRDSGNSRFESAQVPVELLLWSLPSYEVQRVQEARADHKPLPSYLSIDGKLSYVPDPNTFYRDERPQPGGEGYNPVWD
ncbi:MAG: hypothetical protein V1735_00020 [Nanoarchaeota archaeon]